MMSSRRSAILALAAGIACSTTPDEDTPVDSTATLGPCGLVSCVPKSLVIALDGARADALAFAETPNFDAVMSGAWAAGYQGAHTLAALTVPDGDTVSGPNHIAIMTGATVSQVGANSNDLGEITSGDYDGYPHYLARLEQHDTTLNTAYLYTWPTDGGIPSNADFVSPSTEEANAAHIIGMLQGTLNLQTSLGGWSSDMDPDAVFLFIDYIDGAGHAHGFDLDVPEYVAALERADTLVGTILEAVRQRPTFLEEDWQIVVTSDHGGFETGHGGGGAHRETIPFFLSSRTVVSGELPPGTRNIDVAPTVLQHFDAPVPSELVGLPRGQAVTAPETWSPARDVIAHFPFDDDLLDRGPRQHALVPLGDATTVAEGKLGGALQLTSRETTVRLPTASTLGIDAGAPFSISMWVKPDPDMSGDPVLLSNKDWSSGAHPGVAIIARQDDRAAIGANIASRDQRMDLRTVDHPPEAWSMVTLSYDPQGLAILYVGRDDRRLRWIAQPGLQDGIRTGLPIHIGQDGTGQYPETFQGLVDELTVWRRALTREDVATLHAAGQGYPLDLTP